MTQEFFARIENKQVYAENSAYQAPQKSIWGSSVTLNPTTRLNHIQGEGSTHFHKNRGEEYILLSGHMVVYRAPLLPDAEKTIAEMKETVMHPGDKIFISPNTVHTAINLSSSPSTFIEITHGQYDDSDVHRVYDKAGRNKELNDKWAALGYPSGLSLRDLIPIVKAKLQNKENEWPYPEEKAKVVIKPWGREVWLNYREGEEVGEKEKKYVFKKIYVNAGTRMSFQHHEKKQEINFLIAGKVEAWLEKDNGEIEKKIVGANSIWEIMPPKKHRMIALENCILLECSTPEVDDVVRHQDDSGRGDGRIQSEHKTA